MKKIMLAVIIAVVSMSVNAQTSFGVKAGLNLATITGDDTEEADFRTSFNVGAVAEFKIAEKFSIQPEVSYSSQGWESSGSDWKETIKLDYINIPVMAKYYVIEGLSIEAGPQVGFLVSAEAEFEEGDLEGSEDIKDFVSSVDFGLNFGVGYKLDFGLNFGARYNLGLANIADDSDAGDFKNGVLQFSVGYFFN